MNLVTIVLIASSYVLVGEGCVLPGISGSGKEAHVEWPWSKSSEPGPEAPAPEKPENKPAE